MELYLSPKGSEINYCIITASDGSCVETVFTSASIKSFEFENSYYCHSEDVVDREKMEHYIFDFNSIFIDGTFYWVEFPEILPSRETLFETFRGYCEYFSVDIPK